MNEVVSREEGRTVFGTNVEGYQKGRPDYPPRIYQLLNEYIGELHVNDVFEVGPGTGQATENLLGMGFSVTAFEPDTNLAKELQYRLRGKYQGKIKVLNKAFEGRNSFLGSFDLDVAATSWHWIEPLTGAVRAFEMLRPGGCFAVWWTIFEDTSSRDEFQKK